MTEVLDEFCFCFLADSDSDFDPDIADVNDKNGDI